MPVLHRVLLAVIAGSVAGLLAFALDQLSSVVTLGDTVPVTTELALLYPAAGALLGALLALVAMIRSTDERPVGFFGRRLAFALAGLYLAAIIERVFVAAAVHLPKLVALGGGVAVAAAMAVGGVLLARLARDPDAAAPLTIVAAAGILIVNRNLVDHPLSTAGLLLDVLVVLVSLGLAWAIRARGKGLVVGSLIALLLVGALLPRLLRDDAPQRVAAAPDTPNLIFLLLDTLRHDVLTSVMTETPEGRAFAERFADVAWFDDTVAAAPWTAPSVGSIMTGLYPREHGFGTKAKVRDPNRPLRQLSTRVPTLAGRLRNRGYHTEAIITNALLHEASGIHRGFDHFELLGGPKAKLPLLSVAIRLRLIRPGSYQPAEFVGEHLGRRLDILRRAEPFFLWLHFMDPHTPLLEHPHLPPDPTGPQEGDERLYRDEVRYLLAELTRIIDQLDDADLWQDSAVILVADHGEMFPSDDHDNGVISRRTRKSKTYGHGHALYQSLVRVPLAIRPPGGLSETRHVSALASHVDLHDTVIDLLGVDIPKIGRDRVSLAPWVAEVPPRLDPATPIDGAPESGDVPTTAVRTWALTGATQHGPYQRGLRRDRFKLITYDQHVRTHEVYDVHSDPAEQTDLSNDGLLDELRRVLLERWDALSEVRDNDDMQVDDETRETLKALGYVE